MSQLNVEESIIHNNWNLIWLPIVFTVNIYLLCNWNTDNLSVFIIVFLTYLVLDFAWIFVKPYCVATPNIILGHHLVTIAGVLVIPYVDDELKWFICLSSLVEINTWIRLVRNTVKNKLVHVFNALFLISWIIIRLLIGPYIHYMIYKRFINNMSYVNITLFITSTVLNGLSFSWTLQIIQNIKKLIAKDNKNI